MHRGYATLGGAKLNGEWELVFELGKKLPQNTILILRELGAE
jgi:hypothetical protein